MTTANNGDVEAELAKYLEEKCVKALIESIVESLLLEKPDNPICFIVQYLKVRGFCVFSSVVRCNQKPTYHLLITLGTIS